MAVNYKDIFNPLENVLRWKRVNPVVQIIAFVVVLLVCLTIAVVIGAVEGIRLAMKDEKVKQDLPVARAKRKASIDNSKVIYFNVKKVEMSKYCLTQYVKFYIAADNDLKDITNYICNMYFVSRYKGKSERLKGTAKLVDYDIIRLQQSIGKELMETIL